MTTKRAVKADLKEPERAEMARVVGIREFVATCPMYLNMIELHSDHHPSVVTGRPSDGPDLDLYTGSILSRWPAQVQPDTKGRSLSQIAREGKELQRIEAERALRRKSEGGKGGVKDELNSAHLGRTDEHVAESLGISRDRWYKLRKIFTKAEEGDEEAQEMLKAVATGRPSPPLRTTWENLGCCESPLPRVVLARGISKTYPYRWMG